MDTITLTTNRAESSYGRPVLVIDGAAFGPSDFVPDAGATAAELVNTWLRRFLGPDAMTAAQAELFAQNAHLIPVDRLADGDVLAIDADSTDDNPLGPYIITTDGAVQDVAYHYRNYHEVTVSVQSVTKSVKVTGHGKYAGKGFDTAQG